jgi:cytochrome P450
MRPPAPIAIPHATSKDDIYKNWFIPKDTIIVLNLYAVNNNSTRFPNPTVFDPERHRNYVEQSQKKRTFSQSVEDRPHLSFSAGRRVCVGIHLAERNLFMAASMLLSCFKFERISDALIDADTPKDIRATTWCPSSYSIRLVPRHNSVGSFF